MGTGITQALSQAGYEVTARDVADNLLRRGLELIQSGPFGLAKAVEKGKITKSRLMPLYQGTRLKTRFK